MHLYSLYLGIYFYPIFFLLLYLSHLYLSFPPPLCFHGHSLVPRNSSPPSPVSRSGSLYIAFSCFFPVFISSFITIHSSVSSTSLRSHCRCQHSNWAKYIINHCTYHPPSPLLWVVFLCAFLSPPTPLPSSLLYCASLLLLLLLWLLLLYMLLLLLLYFSVAVVEFKIENC